MTEIQDPALIAYEQGDFATAFELWQKLADEGNPQACHNISMLYANGQGIEQNDELAKLWCEKSAQLGHLPAQHHLGYILLESDPETALAWWQKAAEAGLADAQYDLAQQYLIGELVEADMDTAADWYELAAEQGHDGSQFNLGVLYANAKQFANARYWWEKASASGNEQAQEALAQLSQMGY